ncbi:putative NADP+ dependent succinate-semialdehyde dehydrogenase [Novosphingobium sp. Rr 2-17]|uniref:NAD-dependent succinate-semialdehyde dehydrogenase n=1 Tax=Novosphingobium sp. Rr 2-17 TaxID=555793 RepID=UPI0002698262|nr:NAD-dependent succinate-semialdehyde dehydrogenase [Novosphingobium sp. Rr 2-17]EIZ77735.1 putative NADP+ dependent succinate-semialdehyde dehydrogenase [Novosphingobium sp. Rr 2-17]
MSVRISSLNPATDQQLDSFAPLDDGAVDAALARLATAQRDWATYPLSQRLDGLRAVAAVLRAERDSLALLATLEMGKPLTEAKAEIEKCAWNFEYYAQAAPDYLSDQIIASSATDSRVVYDPIGSVLAIMPWNYPFWQVMRAAAPILAGGNGLAIKHASNVPQCALAIEDIVTRAGLPSGIVTTLLIGSAATEAVIQDRRIAAVTFTGSTPVGRIIAAQAGHALKKQVLELGGADPFIVLDDADVEQAARVGAKSRFQNTGQSCIAAKRFILDAGIADRFVDAFCAEVDSLILGDPQDAATTQGPMAKASLRTELHGQITSSIAAGARLVRGGTPIAGAGAFYAPTVLDHVTPTMKAGCEEIFGPAAAIMRVDGADAAISLANDTDYGLSASLWTGDTDRAATLARRINAGAVFVNGMSASDPRLPFGGIKDSGYGRELGASGVHEFTNAKTVWTGPAQL